VFSPLNDVGWNLAGPFLDLSCLLNTGFIVGEFADALRVHCNQVLSAETADVVSSTSRPYGDVSPRVGGAHRAARSAVTPCHGYPGILGRRTPRLSFPGV